MMTKRILRPAIWVRRSRESKEKTISREKYLEKKVAQARRYTQKKGWPIPAKVYSLFNIGGSKLREDPTLAQMLTDVASGEIDAILISDESRLCRDAALAAKILMHFDYKGAIIVVVGKRYDTGTAEGRLKFLENSVAAEKELETIQDRYIEDAQDRAEQGLEQEAQQMGGIAQDGYEWRNGVLVLDPERAPFRKEMTSLFLRLSNYQAVANEIFKRGYRTRKNKHISNSDVKSKLVDPIVNGTLFLNRTKGIKEKAHWVPKPSDEHKPVKSPPLLLNDTYDATQLRAETISGNGRFPAYVCGGKVFCGTCDKKLNPHDKTSGFRCYKCKRWVSAEVLEEFIQRLLVQYAPEMLSLEQYRLTGFVDDAKTLLNAVVKNLQNVQQRMNSILQLHAEGRIGGEHFQTLYRPLKEQQSQLEAHLPDLEAKLRSLKKALERVADHTQLEFQVPDFWPLLTFQEKQSLAMVLISKISLMHNGEVAAQLRLPPNKRP